MASIGEMLREARRAQDQSVADVAAELCITERYVRAIEENDIESLPGLFFFQSFARQYAAILGLDRSRVAAALAAIAEPAGKPAETFADRRVASLRSSTHPSPPVRPLDPIVEDNNRRYFAGYPVGLSIAGLVAAVLVGSGIFAWWTRPPQTVRVAPSAPAKISVPLPVAEPSATGVIPVISPSDTGVSPAEPPSGTDVVPGEPPSARVSGDTPFHAVATIDDANQVTLNLSATERTWLSITSHGKVIFSGILEPSQSKTLKGSEVATMKVGNAGGVDVQWNGKSIGPIGARGQVRTVRFTREDFQILAPESPDQL